MDKNIQKVSLGWGTDAYPAQEPQEQQFQQDRAQMAQMVPPSQDFKWVVAGKNIVVVTPDKLDSAFAALGVEKTHYGPFATGSLSVSHRWTASFVVEQTNIDLDSLYKIFQRWTKQPSTNFENWQHHLHLAVVQDKNGIPLPVGNRKTAADPGAGNTYPNKLWVNTDDGDITDHQTESFPGKGDMRAYVDKITTMPYECPECNEVFENYMHLHEHMVYDHQKPKPTGLEEEIRDNDEYFYPDNEASRPGGTVSEPGIYTGATKNEPPGPIPFSFDVEGDRLYVGQPGDERVEIDSYSPFGTAEGYYTPDGDLLITSQAGLPYTIRHLMNLWSDMYSEYDIKHVYLLEFKDQKRIKEKVAKNVKR